MRHSRLSLAIVRIGQATNPTCFRTSLSSHCGALRRVGQSTPLTLAGYYFMSSRALPMFRLQYHGLFKVVVATHSVIRAIDKRQYIDNPITKQSYAYYFYHRFFLWFWPNHSFCL